MQINVFNKNFIKIKYRQINCLCNQMKRTRNHPFSPVHQCSLIFARRNQVSHHGRKHKDHKQHYCRMRDIIIPLFHRGGSGFFRISTLGVFQNPNYGFMSIDGRNNLREKLISFCNTLI